MSWGEETPVEEAYVRQAKELLKQRQPAEAADVIRRHLAVAPPHAIDYCLAEAGITLADRPNALVFQNNGMDLSVLPDVVFDFAFSTIVFQHIPRREVIESYVREVCRVLRPGALFKFQVQGYTAVSSSPEMMCTGMWRVDLSCFRRSSTVHPSISGSAMSSVIASGR